MGKNYVATVNNKSFEISVHNGSEVNVDGRIAHTELTRLRDDSFSLILDGKVYSIGSNRNTNDEHGNGGNELKTFYLTVIGYDYIVTLDDEHSLLLKSLFKENTAASTLSVIRAPMPGLIVKVEVTEGQHIQKGQGVIILEAMKMENEIRALSSGTIKTIHVQPKKAVEKGEALISFVQA